MTHGIIDLTVFGELCESAGREFARELIDTFAEEAPGMVAQLHAAQAAGEAETFRRAAHSLKSNALTFGALRLAQLARELEQGGLPAESSSTSELEAELDSALQALRELGRD